MKSCYFSMRIRILFLSLFITLLTVYVPAQYQVFSWENFNNGEFPKTIKFSLEGSNDNTTIVNFKGSDAPSGILDGIAATECGNYGVKFQTSKDSSFLIALSENVLDRKTLGENGKSLYQVDFYLSEQSKDVYSMAVLAVVPGTEKTLKTIKMYRLGILNGTYFFFSYMNEQDKPLIYQHELISDFNLKIPGWHRIQIIFEGQDKIICAIDGKASKFSPIIEPSLTSLQAGLMVTASQEESKFKPGTVYADNLSIQKSIGDVPLPESPWFAESPVAQNDTQLSYKASDTKPIAQTASQSSMMKLQPISPQQSAPLTWLSSPDEAWQASQNMKKPILIMFYVPNIETYKTLENVFATDISAKNLLNNFVLLKLDVNQLSGGMQAQNFNIFKVPTFIILNLNGTEKSRVSFGRGMEWKNIADHIQNNIPR